MTDALCVAVLEPDFAPLLSLLERGLEADRDWRFRVVVHDRNRTVLDAWSGESSGDAVQPVASVSKGISGIAVGLLLQRGLLDEEEPVARYWPEFGAQGKGRITVAELLSHRAGLLGFSPGLTWEDATGPGGGADLAGQRASWAPGAGHGYHAFTIGTLVDELFRRITGAPTWEFWESEVAGPEGIDFWLRLPEGQRSRLRPVLPGSPGDAGERRDDLPAVAAAPFGWLDGADHWLNSPRLLPAGIPSVSGAGSAAGIADAYAAAIGSGGRDPLLSPETVARISQLRSAGEDLVLGGHRRYGMLFQKPAQDHDFGTASAFGHDGAGGGLGFADPATGIAFGYLPEAIPTPAKVDARALRLAEAARRIALR